MSSRAFFYLAVLVFLIGVVILALGANAGSPVVTLIGIVVLIVAVGVLLYWLLRRRQAT